MKIRIMILCLTFLIGCKSKNTNRQTTSRSKAAKNVGNKNFEVNKFNLLKIEKLNLAEVDYKQQQKSYELGKRLLLTCNTSKFKPFNKNEATESVINNITIEHLSKTCNKFRQWYGTFMDINLQEVYKNKKQDVTVYRYKAHYSKKNSKQGTTDLHEQRKQNK